MSFDPLQDDCAGAIMSGRNSEPQYDDQELLIVSAAPGQKFNAGSAYQTDMVDSKLSGNN